MPKIKQTDEEAVRAELIDRLSDEQEQGKGDNVTLEEEDELILDEVHKALESEDSAIII